MMMRLAIFLALMFWLGLCLGASADDPYAACGARRYTAQAFNQSCPVDCETIRARVAEHGRATALAWAIGQGYSWREINLAKRMCRI